MKSIKQYFQVGLFVVLHKTVLTFEFVGEIVKVNRSNENYWTVLCMVLFLVAFEFVEKIDTFLR